METVFGLLPENFKLIYSKEDIAYSVYKMAGEIRHWVKETHTNDGQQVLAICILRGGVFFFSDLLKHENVTHHYNFSTNPKFKEALKGAKLAREKKIDVIPPNNVAYWSP